MMVLAFAGSPFYAPFAGIAKAEKFPDSETSYPEDEEWGEWQTTSCFRGIDFSVKKGPYNQYAEKYYWYIQFRNRYNQPVSFNYSMLPQGFDCDMDARKHISSNQDSDVVGDLLDEDGQVRVCIGDFRFKDVRNDFGPYEACDN